MKHPNFVHSLEANTLRQAVNAAAFPCLIRLQMKVQESIWGFKFSLVFLVKKCSLIVLCMYQAIKGDIFSL